MTGSDALETLLSRVAASYDGAAYFSLDELGKWPKAAVATFKKADLLRRAGPATGTTCDGCERYCHMPVEIVSRAGWSAAFVLCDKRDDINRVGVPLDKLERWQASGEAVAAFLAAALQLQRKPVPLKDRKRWPVGSLRDKRAAHLDLVCEEALALTVAGWKLPLSNVLTLRGGKLVPDRKRLVECVNHPVAGGATQESAEERRRRIAARCKELYEQGKRNFRKIVAAEEQCSVETIKDILKKAGFSTRGLPKPNKN